MGRGSACELGESGDGAAPSAPASAPTPEEYAKQAWLARNKPDWRSPSALRADELGHKHINVDEAACPPFVHAPLSYFAPELLTPKGTRRAGGSLVDVGEPEDFSRPLWKSGDGASVGSWACTTGDDVVEVTWNTLSTAQKSKARELKCKCCGKQIQKIFTRAKWPGYDE